MNIVEFKQRPPCEDLMSLADEIEEIAVSIREGRVVGFAYALVPTRGTSATSSFYADDKAYCLIGAVSNLHHNINYSLSQEENDD